MQPLFVERTGWFGGILCLAQSAKHHANHVPRKVMANGKQATCVVRHMGVCGHGNPGAAGQNLADPHYLGACRASMRGFSGGGGGAGKRLGQGVTP